MTTADPISLAQTKRLAANADTILLRATRPADLETPIGAFLRLDDGGPAYLLESVEGGERLGRYSFLGVGPRRLLEVRDGVARIQTRPVTVPTYAPDLPVETADGADPLDAIRAFAPRRRVQPTEGMPRFTGGAVGALAYDAVSVFEPHVPLPDRDPVGVPTAAFIETDLVLVFDHLTHTLSAIASLHTETADLEGRYKIAEAAIFEALERTGRPSAAEIRGSSARRDGSRGAGVRPARTDRHEPRARRSTSTRSRSPRTPSRAARRSRSCWPGGSRSTCRSTPRPARPSTASACIARSAGSTRARTCSSCAPRPSRSSARRPELLLQAEGDKLTTHPIAGTRPRGVDAARGCPARRAAPARPEGARRARDARRPRAQRPGPGRAGPGRSP